VISLLTGVDRAGLEAVTALRAGWLTPMMVLASAWWVKGLVFVGIGAAADLWLRPRRAPATALLAAGAFAVASLLSSGLKAATERARPPAGDLGVTALIDLPADGSFPSGHAATAFAAAGVVAIRYPALRVPLAALAALIALSRVYLGVHYPLDVVAGAALGLAIAWVVVGAAGRVGVPA
jgi:membrane-associated phospholipid phosphatase